MSIRQALAVTERLIGEKGVRLECEMPEKPCVVTGDTDRLMQVLVNLLSNAVKHAPHRDGRIGVILSRSHDRYRVGVWDNGPGVAPADREHVFEKFRQASGGEDKPIGTGLGLPISRRIVEHLGGRIWIESVERKGATFIFELPVSDAGG